MNAASTPYVGGQRGGLAWTALPAGLEPPDDETLAPVADAVRALLGVLASGERLGGRG